MIKNFFNTNNYIYEEEASLKKYNTYRIDIKAKYIVFPKTIEELINILKFIKENKIKHYILGNGSNIILSMNYYDGIIIKLDKLNSIKYEENIVTVEAGYSLIKLAIETINKGLSGLEFAAGIPGNVGASVAMNAGAYNSDISSILKSIKVLTPDLKIIEMNKNELDFSYRNSYLKENKGYIVLEATFEFQKGNTEEMQQHVNDRKNKRLMTQPLEFPSAGSVFRNPEGMYAGELIEKLNLKGYTINDAQVSTKHANFIINTGNCKGEDIINIINTIRKKVKEEYKVDLILEQIIVE